MTDLSALYALRLRTPRLELRLGSHEELVELARLARRGIHRPDDMPFAVAWTDRSSEPDFVETSVAFHERALAEWSPEKWTLNLLVWAEDELAGTQGASATGFAERRRVSTGSWLGHAFQGRGLGTEMRSAVLELAFRALGAESAESSWLEGNEASRRVSEKLGYAPAGTRTQSPRGAPVADHVVALERAAWRCPLPVEIEGLEPCLPLFGVSGEPSAPS